jgi:hypothetical protein
MSNPFYSKKFFADMCRLAEVEHICSKGACRWISQLVYLTQVKGFAIHVSWSWNDNKHLFKHREDIANGADIFWLN